MPIEPTFNLFIDAALTTVVTSIDWVSPLPNSQIDQNFFFGSLDATRKATSLTSGQIMFLVSDTDTGNGISVFDITVATTPSNLDESTSQSAGIGTVVLGGVANAVQVFLRKRANAFEGTDNTLVYGFKNVVESVV